MKRIRFSALVILFVAAFQTISCDVEPIDPAVLSDTPTNPTNPNPTDPGDGGTSSGDYYPTALDNKWTYSQDGTSFDMKMISINSIAGNTYYTFDSLFGAGEGMIGSATGRLRKSGGNYHMRIEDIVISGMGLVPDMTISGNETIILKDNIELNQTWTQDYVQTTSFADPLFPDITMNVHITGKILEKESTVTVGGTTYEHVIKTSYVQEASGVGVEAETVTTYYWFAKDIGPVKIEMVDADGTTLTELQSYDLN